MTDLPEETVQEYQYVLNAVWQTEDGHTAHRVIHSIATGEWNPKALIHEYIRQEHPQWLPEGVGKIGYVGAGDKVRVSGIQVYKVTDNDREEAFDAWKEEAEEKRKVIDLQRMRAADIATILALCRKHEIDEPKIDEEKV